VSTNLIDLNVDSRYSRVSAKVEDLDVERRVRLRPGAVKRFGPEGRAGLRLLWANDLADGCSVRQIVQAAVDLGEGDRCGVQMLDR
jgi:hypothetical protein